MTSKLSIPNSSSSPSNNNYIGLTPQSPLSPSSGIPASPPYSFSQHQHHRAASFSSGVTPNPSSLPTTTGLFANGSRWGWSNSSTMYSSSPPHQIGGSVSTIGANPMSLPTSSILNSTLPLSRVVSGGNNTGGSGGPGGTAADGIGLFRRLSVGFGTSRPKSITAPTVQVTTSFNPNVASAPPSSTSSSSPQLSASDSPTPPSSNASPRSAASVSFALPPVGVATDFTLPAPSVPVGTVTKEEGVVKARGRSASFGGGTKAKRKISPMGERMLRGDH